ncbi:MAG: hypothetical protein F4107_03115 [Gemmatimonadetes bacterium]|nr:hypothetical protein [Gemmatimonadota bacterium]MYD12009.1 hypothetical protein [Gemmatimonadota bacterium]MYI64915.1 hypothetical protein [Gemmatimonadota bacterium]
MNSIVEISFNGLVLACVATLTTACATGGRAPPVTGPEAEAIFAALTGQWVLDERESSSPMDVPPAPEVEVESFIVARGPGESGQSFGDVGDIEAWLATHEKAREVLARWPATLVLRVDGQQLVYTPTPGESVTVPMSGESTTQFEGDHRVQTRVVWDDGKLGLEHSVDAEAWVREVLEAVDGRLIMTRTMRVVGEVNSAPPLVLVYDREEGES